jgi:DNA-binding protein YbaB
MPAKPETNPTKAALEAAVLDLTDDEIVEALLRRAHNDIKSAYEARKDYTWPMEAKRNVLATLALRLESGRRVAKS